MGQSKEHLIKLGFVAHPHGIKGEAELRLLNTDFDSSVLEEGMKLWLFPSSNKSQIHPQGEEWTLSKLRFGNKVIATFEGIKDRTQLESMIPFEFYLDRKDFPETEDDEFYLVDLVGMKVISPKGEELGVLEGFSDNGVQYLFEVRLLSGGSVTLPYVDVFFPEVDVEKGFITMVMPEFIE